MVGNKLEHDIINVFSTDITRSLSINQLAILLHKPYPYIHKKVTDLLDAGILSKQVVGRSFLCSLNFHEPQTVFLHAALEAEKKKRFEASLSSAQRALLGTLLLITKKYPVRLLLYAEERFVLVMHDQETQRKLSGQFSSAHVHILTRERMQRALLHDKRYVKNVIVLYSFEGYAELIAEIQDQLKAKWLFEVDHA